jgi:hypothetical protein
MDEVFPDRTARRAAVIAAARQRAGNDRSKAEEAELQRRAAVARRQENINYWGSPTQEHTLSHTICQTVTRVGQDYADQGSPLLVRFTSSANDPPPHCVRFEFHRSGHQSAPLGEYRFILDALRSSVTVGISISGCSIRKTQPIREVFADWIENLTDEAFEEALKVT